jgi:hypothetical protein
VSGHPAVTARCGTCDEPWPCGAPGHGGRPWRTESVFVATPHTVNVTAAWSWSMLCMLANDIQGHQMLVRGGGPMMAKATPMNLTVVRNQFCAQTLDNGADWLLLIDSDAGFEPDLAARLVQAADPIERPVVGALAFMVESAQSDGMGGYHWRPAPTIYDWGGPGGKPGFFVRWEYPDNTVTRVGATGCHALLVHRGVLEAMQAAYGATWFDRIGVAEVDGLLGEDFSFCAKAQKLGVPVHVHTGVKTTHQQTVWLSEETFTVHRGMDLLRAEALRSTPPAGVVIAPPRPTSEGVTVHGPSAGA